MSKQKFLEPKNKRDTKSWQKRNEARSVLQAQYVARTEAIATADFEEAHLGVEPDLLASLLPGLVTETLDALAPSPENS